MITGVKEYRKGDVVVIHAEIKRNVTVGDEDDSHVSVTPLGDYGSVVVGVKSIVGLHCRKWKEDDVASWTEEKGPVTVIAVHDDKCWIRLASGHLATAYANDLEPLPPVKDEVPIPVETPPLRVVANDEA